MRAETSDKTLAQQCFEKLQGLRDRGTLSAPEQALYERIMATTDPLAWREEEADQEVAESLWAWMTENESQKIQIAAVVSSLRGLRAVSTAPTDGYI